MHLAKKKAELIKNGHESQDSHIVGNLKQASNRAASTKTIHMHL